MEHATCGQKPTGHATPRTRTRAPHRGTAPWPTQRQTPVFTPWRDTWHYAACGAQRTCLPTLSHHVCEGGMMSTRAAHVVHVFQPGQGRRLPGRT
eukprot:8842493-Alexandrium_andersonii.AAC.1